MRAIRLPLTGVIDCRTAPNQIWQTGKTINISRSGVLFEVMADQPPSGAIEFRLSTSGDEPSYGVPDMLCEGRVVRTEASTPGVWKVAVTIDSYRYA